MTILVALFIYWLPKLRKRTTIPIQRSHNRNKFDLMVDNNHNNLCQTLAPPCTVSHSSYQLPDSVGQRNQDGCVLRMVLH
jgi:hypothetical protein